MSFIPQSPITITQSGLGSVNIAEQPIENTFQAKLNDTLGILSTQTEIMKGLFSADVLDTWAERYYWMGGVEAIERTQFGGEVIDPQRPKNYEVIIGSRRFTVPIALPIKELRYKGALGDKMVANLGNSALSALNRKADQLIIGTIKNAPFDTTYTDYDPSNYLKSYVINGAGAFSATLANFSFDCLDVAKQISAENELNIGGLDTRLIALCNHNTLRKIRNADSNKLLNFDFATDKTLQNFDGTRVDYGNMVLYAPKMNKDTNYRLTDNEIYVMQSQSIKFNMAKVEYQDKGEDLENDYRKWIFTRDMGAGIMLAPTLIKIVIN